MTAQDDRPGRLTHRASEIQKAAETARRPATGAEKQCSKERAKAAERFEQEKTNIAKEQAWSTQGSALFLIALCLTGTGVSAYLKDAMVFGAVVVFAVLALVWWHYRR